MVCPKCHTKLNKDIKYCSHCGTKINSTRNTSEWSSFSSKKKEKKDIERADDQYIRACLGDNTEIMTGHFSIYAAIFGPFYLIYKKMYKQAFFISLIYIMTYIYLSEGLGILIRLVLNILLGFEINDYYYQEIKKRVGRIKKKYKDSKTIIEKCREAGKPLSLIKIIPLLIMYVALIGITKMSLSPKKQDKDHYTIYNMAYKIPSTVQETANHNNYQHFKDSKQGTCFITITGEKTNLSEEEYYTRNQENYYHWKEKEKKEVQYQENTWLSIQLESNDTTKDLYIKKEQEILYILTFDAYKKDACKKDKKEILNSIHFQKNF